MSNNIFNLHHFSRLPARCVTNLIKRKAIYPSIIDHIQELDHTLVNFVRSRLPTIR